MTDRLADVARKHGLPVETLAEALDTVLTAAADPRAAGDTTVHGRSEMERALDVALLLTDSLTVEEVSDRLGIPVFQVTRFAADGDLLALTLAGESGTPRFPTWQFTPFTDDGVLPYLGAVLHRLPGHLTPVEVSRWMTTSHPGLTVEDGVVMSPRVWLLYAGDPGPVLDLAPQVAAQGQPPTSTVTTDPTTGLPTLTLRQPVTSDDVAKALDDE